MYTIGYMFKESVLRVVSRIPRGKTLSYGTVARMAGYPRAYRAVGSLMAQNIDPRIPCHRVVKSDGSLGGYNRGGAVQKKRLLEKEGVEFLRGAWGYRVK